MFGFEDTVFYGYCCFSGCGRNTLTDKRYKTKRTFCSVCGEKSEMQYMGEFKVSKVKRFPDGVIDFGIS